MLFIGFLLFPEAFAATHDLIMIENSIAFTVHIAMLIVVKLRLTVFQNASFLAFKFCPEWRSERRLYLRPEIFTVNAIVFSTKHYYKTLFKPKKLDREHTPSRS